MGNAASALPYSIGKPVALVNHGWALHEGQRKSDGAPVSVFLAKKPALTKAAVDPREPHRTQLAPALHHFVHCKKLRHPHILTVLATLDTDNPQPDDAATTSVGSAANTTNATGGGANNNTGDFIVVTEPCIPLETWLSQQQRPSPEELAWALECMVQALHFLHASAGLCHGAISPESWYVTPAGDVKLWNFALVTAFHNGNNAVAVVPRHFVDWESLVTPAAYRSPERVEGRWDAIAAAGVHVVDAFSLGMMVSHLFGNNNALPAPLVKAVSRLTTGNLKLRPRSLPPLLKCPVFDTPYQKMQHQLGELAVAPVEQKIQFWYNVTPNLQAQIIPESLAVYKLLPLIKVEIETICGSESLRAQESYRKEVLTTLNPLFYIAENFLDRATVGVQLGKIIAILFKVNDRAIRGTLLQKAPFMAESFDKNTLNEAVFEPMCSGFSDSSAALRELTLKATAALVPHLTHPNLEKLSRYLVRLQSDPESSIRTNTVIFFSKLAPFLTESTRQKMLLPAFERAMKDPFTPCRLAALKSTLKAKEFFDPMGIACRVLPVITPQLLDPSPEVRREALIAVDDLLFVLRQESERLNRLPVSEPAQLNPGTGQSTYVPNTGMAPAVPVNGSQAPSGLTSSVPAAPKSGSSFSLGGISSWMTSSKSSAPVVNNSSAVTTAPSAVPPQQPHMTQQNYHATAPVGTQHHISQPSVPISRMKSIGFNENVNDDFGGDDGWDDEDDLDVSAAGDKARGGAPVSDFGFSAPAATASASGSLFVAPTSDDDFFGSFDAKPAKPMAMRTMSSGGSKLIMPAKKVGTKPAVQKLSTDTDNASDGWDDF